MSGNGSGGGTAIRRGRRRRPQHLLVTAARGGGTPEVSLLTLVVATEEARCGFREGAALRVRGPSEAAPLEQEEGEQKSESRGCRKRDSSRPRPQTGHGLASRARTKGCLPVAAAWERAEKQRGTGFCQTNVTNSAETNKSDSPLPRTVRHVAHSGRRTVYIGTGVASHTRKHHGGLVLHYDFDKSSNRQHLRFKGIDKEASPKKRLHPIRYSQFND
ncbi:hypothetical protein MRX96_019737 [Rhipicephalus microplus]